MTAANLIERRRLRQWLEHVVESALEMLDELDGDPDLEDDECEDDREAA